MREAASRPSRAAALNCFLLVLLVTAAYQACYCFTMCRGDLSGLFFIAGAAPQPPDLPPAFSYRGSPGYDGQFYRLLAHDPLLRKGYVKYVDDPRYRSRRILIPASAALLGARSPIAVDFWYIAVTDTLMALGGVCFVFLAVPSCCPYAAAVLYLFIPAIVASTDRMVVDGPALAAFLAAWLFLRDERYIPLLAVLSLAPLIREVNVCITAGCLLIFLRRRDGRRAVSCCVTLLPTVLWWCFVYFRTPPSNAGRALVSVPLLPLVLRLFSPYQRPAPWLDRNLLLSLDLIACLCLLFAFAWLSKAIVKEVRQPGGLHKDTLLVLPAAILGTFVANREILSEPFAFMRVNSILVAWAALRLLWVRPFHAAVYLPLSSLALLVFRASPLFRFVRLLIG